VATTTDLGRTRRMEWEEAVAVAARAHGRQRDRSGVFELAHGIEVASALVEPTDDELAAAVLHDVLEDTSWSADDLRAAGVPDVVVEAVEHVSRIEEPEQERYRDFIERTARAAGESGRIARRVKEADLLVNMERVHSLPDGESMRRKRYVPALERIREAMRERGEL
jgi:(p)ppGpp synthase/HD superfamily hydrolase